MSTNKKEVFSCNGQCSTCDHDTRFVAYHTWFRDFFVCSHYGSIPRERALMIMIERWFPKWREAVIHESSPAERGASVKLARECPNYIGSQHFAEQSDKQNMNCVRNENLERLTFGDSSVDLHITQDVFEHVLDPEKAFQEIARTLRPGGMHIFTVPLVNKDKPSRVRAKMINGGIHHLLPEQYHGNPVGDGRALVTVDWGYDICEQIFRASRLFTHIVHMDDLERGLRAEYLEVLVTTKPKESLPLSKDERQ